MLVDYHSQKRQHGGYPVFVGRSHQLGAGFGSTMSSIFRNLIVPAAKNVGKSVLKTGLRKAGNVMQGVADGKNVGQAVMEEVGFAPMKRSASRSTRPAKKRKVVQKRKPTPKLKRRPRRQRDIFD